MKLNNIDEGKAFDWSLTSQDYAKYRDIYPEQLYIRLRELGVAADGSAWLDIGTGTGVLPQNMYNENAVIYGADISDGQIRFAKMNAEKNGQNIEYFIAPAENMGLPDNSFDCITAAQCFWYFDREKMREEISRMLKPGGTFIKIFMNWDTEDEIAAKSIALIKEFNPLWNDGCGADDIHDDLFDGRVTEIFDCEIPFTRESWHGRMCACRGTLASMDKATFDEWRDAHKKLLEQFPESFGVKHKTYISYFRL